MIRKIIKIDQEACNGCGLCVEACHEGAIGLQNGKAVLLRDDYCDGLGDCLPVCPTNAISFESREAAAYDEEAVIANMTAKEEAKKTASPLPCGCPGSHARSLIRPAKEAAPPHAPSKPSQFNFGDESQLNQWPVQIKLVPVNAPYFQGARLLIAADCAAYAYSNFHQDFMKGKITIIGCPKLDQVDYREKLTAILSQNEIKSVTVVRMEVPCCAGIASAVTGALKHCGKMIPWQVVTLSTDGHILSED